MKGHLLDRRIFLAGVAILVAVLLFIRPSPLHIALAQDANANKSTSKKTPPTKTTPKKRPPATGKSPASREPSCQAQSPTQGTGRGYTLNLSGGVKLQMVEIPTGSFCMGSSNRETDEKPLHRVTIGQSFYMGKYEVTQAQWQTVMGANPSYFKGDDSLPVEQVSWDDAQEFINKLNEMNDGYKYRLPTEAEWEYACRAGTTGDYYAQDVDDIGWYADNSGKNTHRVGSKQANAFGLYDMSGNVWEWCRDWFVYGYEGAPTDGSARLLGGEMKSRVLRGGSWYRNATLLRSAYRSSYLTPDDRSYFVGFRLVAVVRTQ